MTRYRNEPDIPIEVKHSSGGTFTALWNGVVTECRFGCGSEIGFAKTRQNKFVPIDPPDDENSPADPHFANCPHYPGKNQGKGK